MRLQDLLETAVAQGRVPGAVAVIDRGGRAEVAVAGRLALEGPPLREDAIFRIQSMTKVVTAVAALRLVEGGALALGDPVERWLPELAERRVLRAPDAELDDTVPAERPITLADLLVNGCGYGMEWNETPLQRAMADAGVAPGPDPTPFGSDEFLRRLSGLPLAHQPGRGFRYHTSFAVLGALLGRVVGCPLADHLRDELFAPLGMGDTGFWAPEADAARLPAVYRLGENGLEETQPYRGGTQIGEPTWSVDHEELVSTAADFLAFARMLRGGGELDGRRYLSPESLRELTRDQVVPEAKTPDSFFPGFWDDQGWGYGVCVTLRDHPGRYGWSGGLGTDFVVDPDADAIALLLTQVEMGEDVMRLAGQVASLLDR